MLDASRGQKLANLTSKTNISNLDTEITILTKYNLLDFKSNSLNYSLYCMYTLDYCNIKIDPMGQLFEEKWEDLNERYC